jgi:formate dehydrogenase iron-sulfur subunit
MEECPFRAITRQADGIVRIDPAKCFPDRCSRDLVKPCQDECEFDEIPRYRYIKDGSAVITKMRKCDFCYDRINNATLDAPSKKPACQIACPPGAISFGDADPLLVEARNRVNDLKTRGWPDAKVYPGQSDDATHVIWVLTNRESQYGQED